ncbi:MAG TPA: TIGR03668 family PPOX class F420-dependent oxidoreductase [Blastocatellia bacterium]|nr:TIGR03668 family PPOX class F420-dependent oxidoreductase [Blastocatellia bacterium]
MEMLIDQNTAEFIRDHRVGRLATVGADLQPAVIPVCYVFDGEHIYTPIDEKPKSVEAGALRRVRNIRVNSRVALVVDDYSEDWGKLIYVLVSGNAEVILPSDGAREHERAVELLRDKYEQYCSMKIEERPMIKITPVRIKRWTPAKKGGNK